MARKLDLRDYRNDIRVYAARLNSTRIDHAATMGEYARGVYTEAEFANYPEQHRNAMAKDRAKVRMAIRAYRRALARAPLADIIKERV